MSIDSSTEAALDAAKLAAQHNVDLSKLPQMLDLTASNITQNVISINSGCQDARTKLLMEKLVHHLHDFVRETEVTTEEWMNTIQFLTRTGQTCSDIRQEFILLSDVLGVSALVDTMNNAKPEGATEATVLGPFFTTDAPDVPAGESIASEGKGDYLWVEGKVTSLQGEPVAGAVIETWETDEHGLYDTQYSERATPDCRGRIVTGADGRYCFRAVVPVPYPIPSDGPVGGLAPGYETLITALYFPGDPYLLSDAVFGVKNSLVSEMTDVADVALSKQRGFSRDLPHKELKRDFVLATPQEGSSARKTLDI